MRIAGARYDRLIREAIADPHPAIERFESDFMVVMRCEDCGKLGRGPRSQLSEAMREHRASCPALQRHTEAPHMVRLLYPRQ